MKQLLILCITLQSMLAYSACDKNVEYVKVGETILAKCDGFFVKYDTMNELKKNDEILKIQDEKIKNLEQISFKQEQISKFYQDRTTHLSSELNKSESRSFWKGIGMFALGVLVTGAASYAVITAL